MSSSISRSGRPRSASRRTAGSFAAAYDDRLTANALRFAERVNGRWSTTIVATTINGARVGREPMLAISRTGIRLIAFRTEVSLDPAKPPSGTLYAARANRGGPWVIDPIDADAFGESAAFDRQGHPAIAYLVRTGTDDQAQVRLARLLGGKWSVETLDTTTYRVAPGGANASSVGSRVRSPGQARGSRSSTRRRTRFGSSLPGSRARESAMRPWPRCGPSSPSARTTQSPSWPPGSSATTSRCGCCTATIAVAGAATRSASRVRARPTIVAFSGRRPVIAYRDPESVSVARPSFAGTYALETVLTQAAPPSSRVSSSLGAARMLDDVGVALVSPKGLLEFASRPLG